LGFLLLPGAEPANNNFLNGWKHIFCERKEAKQESESGADGATVEVRLALKNMVNY
jgi:hypothetical protein